MVTLRKGQYLSNIMPMIPTNCILSKRIPGCGATTLEIMTDRNSIIIVPNVPVINSKEKKFPNMKGVYEDVTVSDVVNYLKENSQYKIMTTPESFDKVKTACKRCGLNIYSDFFLLDDECHQLVKDVDFRGDIVLPMDDFFQFEHKALVSATPIKFSDPRFKGFNTIEICADYNYQQDITVTHTYNTVVAVKDYLQNHDGIICIFFNSVEGIISLIKSKQFGMSEENTSIYCAPKSRTKLKSDYDFTNAYHEWSASTMKKYNFFTARFYTAFDLELDYKPDLLMITDPHLSPYTMLDVDTDCIQICGRFRNGISSVTHIYRNNPSITSKTREQLEWEISAHEFAYQTVKSLYNSADSKGSRYAFGKALETLPFRKYLYPNLTKNWFAIDNAINDALVEGKYKFQGQLDFWYEDCHFFIPSFKQIPFKIDDEKLKKVKTARSVKDRRRKMVQLLSECKKPYSENDYDFINKIRQIDPKIVEAYEVLGKRKIEELNYSPKRMEEEIILKQRKGTKVVRLIKNSFKIGNTYTYKYIEKELSRIFGLKGIHPEKPINHKLLNDYFQTVNWRSDKSRGYKIVSAKL